LFLFCLFGCCFVALLWVCAFAGTVFVVVIWMVYGDDVFVTFHGVGGCGNEEELVVVVMNLCC
jgi:hypothetical protein